MNGLKVDGLIRPGHVGRLNYLDSLRALAAIGVVYLHLALRLQGSSHGFESKLLYFFTMSIDPGKIGVILFFMISGFVIPLSFKTDRATPIALRDFVLGRLFRLYPVYWLSILLSFIFVFHGALTECSIGRILLNGSMFQGFVGGVTINMLGVYWTLQIEWMFYILCMGLFALGWLSRPSRILGAYVTFLVISFLVALARFHFHRALPLAAPLGLCVMLAAGLWRMAMLDGIREAKLYARVALVSFALAIPVISLLAYNFNSGYGENWYRYTWCYWIGVGFFLLATTKVHLTWRPLVIVGRASFSLYLLSSFAELLFDRFIPADRIIGLSPNLYIAIMIVFCSLAAVPVYYFVERPGMAAGKKLAHHLDSRRVLSIQVVDSPSVTGA